MLRRKSCYKVARGIPPLGARQFEGSDVPPGLRLVEQRYMRNCVLRARLITGAYLVLRRSTSANAEQTKTSTFGNYGYRKRRN